MAVPLIVLSGPESVPRESLGEALTQELSGCLWVRYELHDLEHGVVHREVRGPNGTAVEREVAELAHGCVSCTLRLDVLPTLVRLARSGWAEHLVLELPGPIDPAHLVECLYAVVLEDGRTASESVVLAAAVTGVDSCELVPTLAAGDLLAQRGSAAAAEDDRSAGEVLAHQLETADVVAMLGDVHPDDVAVLRGLNPTARVCASAVAAARCTGHLLVGSNRSLVLSDFRMRADAVGVPAPDLNVADPDSQVRLRTRRPLHPARLHDALDDLVVPTLRGRGRFWLATRPGAMLAWSSAGPWLSLSDHGPWLVADRDAWTEAPALARLRAELDWAPYYGDRLCELLFVGVGLDGDRLRELFAGCALTDDELALGEDRWRRFADPFGSPEPQQEAS